MVVSDVDLRLLRVFRAVVESGGFSNAQVLLNVSQSTISTQMSQLETRLGVRLCHRGRSGFSLTEEGEACYLSTVELFRALVTFQSQADQLRGALHGRLRVAFLDNVVTDPCSPLKEAFRQFVRRPGNEVRLALDVLSPEEMERRLLDRRLDVAIGIFYSRLPSLIYRPIYRETDVLVCSRTHVIANLRNPADIRRALQSARKVVRSFLGELEFPPDPDAVETANISVSNVEAAVHLILTGEYVGFLPRHYAKLWIERDEMLELLPDELEHHSDFSYVTHVAAQEQSAVCAFIESLEWARSRNATARP